jgi:hypothetical protein
LGILFSSILCAFYLSLLVPRFLMQLVTNAGKNCKIILRINAYIIDTKCDAESYISWSCIWKEGTVHGLCSK